MDEFQQSVGEWADRTFPKSNLNTIAAHLSDEAAEFVDAARFTSFLPLAASEHTDRKEAADMFLLLLHYAHRRGFSLEQAAREKHAINQQRQWGQPDERGVVRHVETFE